MDREDMLPPEDRKTVKNQPSSDAVPPVVPAVNVGYHSATVTAQKALLWEIKSRNKAGRPIMRIHEPRQRFDTGAVLLVDPAEIEADGGVIYLLSVDFPDLYLRKIDLSLGEG